MDIDREQEYLTNTLHRRMSQILREKQDLENQLKIEQDYVNMSLQKKVEAVKAERAAIVFESRTNNESLDICNELAHIVSLAQNEVARDSRVHGDLEKAAGLVAALEKHVGDYERRISDCKCSQ
jgi:hypothetical protein